GGTELEIGGLLALPQDDLLAHVGGDGGRQRPGPLGAEHAVDAQRASLGKDPEQVGVAGGTIRVGLPVAPPCPEAVDEEKDPRFVPVAAAAVVLQGGRPRRRVSVGAVVEGAAEG